MLSSSFSSGGTSPVWVTVVAARFVAGLVGGLFSVALTGSAAAGLVPASSAPGPAARLFGILGPTVVSALVTGTAISVLLPQISGRRVGVGNAIVAALVGALLPLIAILALAGGAASSPSAVLAGGMLVVAASSIAGVAVTSWMVASTASDMERWRGKPVSSTPAWSEIESIDRVGTRLDEDQAERGYWGGMDAPDQPAT